MRDLSDPYARLDGRDPFEELSNVERAELHAALAAAEKEIAAGKGLAADGFLRELRATR